MPSDIDSTIVEFGFSHSGEFATDTVVLVTLSWATSALRAHCPVGERSGYTKTCLSSLFFRCLLFLRIEAEINSLVVRRSRGRQSFLRALNLRIRNGTSPTSTPIKEIIFRISFSSAYDTGKPRILKLAGGLKSLSASCKIFNGEASLLICDVARTDRSVGLCESNNRIEIIDQLSAVDISNYSNSYNETIAIADQIKSQTTDQTDANCPRINPAKRNYYFCGGLQHARTRFPPNTICNTCGKQEHFVCLRSEQIVFNQLTSSAAIFLAYTRGPDTKQLLTTLSIQGRYISALVDTGSSLNFINKRVVDKLNTVVIPSETIVHLASSVSKRVLGRCELDFELLGLEINREKSKYRLTSIKCLGYEISYNILRPDTDRLCAVKRIKISKDKLTLQCLMGFFAYYSKWIKNFSAKVASLTGAYVEFPLNKVARKAIDVLKEDISNVIVHTISENEPFTIDTDASKHSISAILFQQDRSAALATKLPLQKILAYFKIKFLINFSGFRSIWCSQLMSNNFDG
ncbi:hypothetical protein GJ496_006492 [Pomphorhynchus laevis]|nr:hypothetical protein GJ496_006492 [Pomphorhynchus laevis]